MCVPDFSCVAGDWTCKERIDQGRGSRCSGCPRRPLFSGTTPHLPIAIACSNDAHKRSRLAALNGGQSTSVIIAASQPRFKASCRPICKELNCPRSGAGLRTIDAPFAAVTGFDAVCILAAYHYDEICERPEAPQWTQRAASRRSKQPNRRQQEAMEAVPCLFPCALDAPAARITPHMLYVLSMRKP